LNKTIDNLYEINTAERFIGIIERNIFKDLLIKKNRLCCNNIGQIETDSEYTVVETISPNFDEIDISESEIVIGGGRGLEKKEYFDFIPKLARVLNAGYGGTRVAVDYKWITHERQIGRTGKILNHTYILL